MQTRCGTSFYVAALVRTSLPSITGQRGVVTVTNTNLPATPRLYRLTVP